MTSVSIAFAGVLIAAICLAYTMLKDALNAKYQNGFAARIAEDVNEKLAAQIDLIREIQSDFSKHRQEYSAAMTKIALIEDKLDSHQYQINEIKECIK